MTIPGRACGSGLFDPGRTEIGWRKNLQVVICPPMIKMVTIMTTHVFALFDTAIGCCGIAWGARGIIGVQLPEGSPEKSRARLRRRFAGIREAAPPAHIQQVIDDIVALVGGERRDFAGAALDMEHVPDFHRRVYEIARTVEPGATISYGEIATKLGDRLL